ncbi:DUF2339 domain-containing protein [Natrarchaeobaculum aegyptiacum]|uniref:DUF2339 domain-containing protein n=1 Tax=Natrarchaeobaculum aegyptiacum TaxID=745377 RepID=A0A2Z2HQN3_9EURY|nr:DUF2339 domain-containing protein [Natrarchaeobaculum aegyptiacum]ARS89460.1 hypothetical protein B1756_06675 [Natrarchaeobaculum aegyptiacum]
MDDDLASEVRRLRSDLESLHRRVETLEAALDDEERPAEDTLRESVADESGAVDSTAESASEPAIDSTAESVVGETVLDGESSEPTATDGQATERGRDIERDVGIRWLGLVGGLALVVGVIFFVQLAIEAGWLGPLGRVLLGTAGGLLLAGVGRFVTTRQGYVRWGHIATGVGLAIAYFSIYAAYGFDAYRVALGTPLWLVLLALTALVVGAVGLSIRASAPVVGGEAFLFGYVTAWLSIDAGSFVLTPAYVLALAAGLVAVSTVRPWRRHLVASVPLTYGLVWVWFVDLEPGALALAAVTLVAFALSLAGASVLHRDPPESRLATVENRALTLLSALPAAALLEFARWEWAPDAPLEGAPTAVVAIALAGLYVWTDAGSSRRDQMAGGLAVVLFGASAVLAGGVFASTVGLVAVVCGAVAVASRFDAVAVRHGAHVVAAALAFKLVAVDATQLPALEADPQTIATGRAGAFLIVIAASYGLAWWFSRTEVEIFSGSSRTPLAVPYAWLATGLVVVFLGLELSGAGISVAWAAFGLVLVTTGLTADVRGLRMQGVAVFALATAKVFLFDTQDLDLMARTLAFLALGAILLVASYAYARWQGQDPLERFVAE